ncbi:hypothetical protein N8Z24_00795, partial [bacterium]|nr:hypothetical protein [bacterium]
VPRVDTREAACGDPLCAYKYSRMVDMLPTVITRTAAYKDAEAREIYKRWERSYHRCSHNQSIPGKLKSKGRVE